MVTLRHAFKMVQLASFGLLLGWGLNGQMWAGELSKIMDVQASAVDNQVILSLSEPNQASLMSPLDKGQRKLLLDIKNASLQDLNNKKVLLKTVKDQLGDVAEVTLDEFRGPEPVVRLMVKTTHPEVTGTLLKADGNTLVLQLLKPQVPSQSTEETISTEKNMTTALSKESSVGKKQGAEVATGEGVPEKTEMPALPELPNELTQQPDKLPSATLSGKATVTQTDSLLEQKIREADSLRTQRNKLEERIASLQIIIDQQNAMIAHLREEQEKLLTRSENRRERQEIQSLQKKLSEIQKSYDEIRRDLESYQKEVATLESALKQAEQKTKAMEEQQQSTSGTIQLPPPAERRGGLLNTLADLTQPEVNKLLEAEKAFREAKKYDFEKNYAQAESKYRTALSLAPQVSEYAVALGLMLMGQKQYDKAQQVLEAALRYHPEDSAILNELGKTALLQKNEAMALKYFSQAVPAGVLSNYASTLKRANKLADAEAVYKLAVALAPGDSDLQFNLGNLYLSQKRYTEAQDRFKEALRINPQFAEAHYHLGITYIEQGQLVRGREELSTYLSKMPDAANKTAVEAYIKDLDKISQPAAATVQ